MCGCGQSYWDSSADSKQGGGEPFKIEKFSSMDSLNDAIDELFPIEGEEPVRAHVSFFSCT